MTRAWKRGRGWLLLGVLLPSSLLAACDGILGIPSDITEGDVDASGDAELSDVTARADAADGHELDGTVTDGGSRMDASDASGDSAPADGAPADAADSGCDPLSPFGAAVPITELNTGVAQGALRLNDDETLAFFNRVTPNETTYDLYTATKVGGVFGTATPSPAPSTPRTRSSRRTSRPTC